MVFKDHFSGHAETYAQARPSYPDALFDFLQAQCASHDLAWDCATGNGQAAEALARIFKQVIATDGSAEQIAQARPAANIVYRQAAAEERFLEANSCDLITVAQALHWFDLEAFFRNVEHSLKADGVLAVWNYGVHTINASIDAVVTRLYEDILGDYWPPERRLVENHYRDIEFPFVTSIEEGLSMERDWNMQQLRDYLHSWSALQRFMGKNGSDPFLFIEDDLKRAWGNDGEKRYRVVWPLTVIVARQ